MTRPFRFGISFGGAPTRAELVASLRRAEAAGFTVAATADHISDRHAVIPFLATVAELSPLRVAPFVLANDYRHPVVVARDAATIDVLSEGRLELGIGTGWILDQYEAAGITRADPVTTVDRFEEAIAVINGCWRGQPFTMEGRHYRVAAVTCPRPVQRPRPPLLIAGSRRRLLGIAGREADIVSISPLRRGDATLDDLGSAMVTSGDRIERQVEWVRAGAGNRFAAIELNVMAHHVAVTDDPDTAVAELAAATGTTPPSVLASPHVLVGPEGRIVETLLERRERLGISYVMFRSLDLDQVAPIASRLAGT
ncbi:MAG TPA: TIGR03621 family F420-dependent LLM class oxidoreductase [Acidimicrobiales bacterium]